MRMLFGKYKGKTLDEIATEDPSYLRWLHDEASDLKVDLKRAIAKLIGEADQSQAEIDELKEQLDVLKSQHDHQIKEIAIEIGRGYRSLLLKVHPDRGGDHDTTVLLAAVFTELRRLSNPR